MVSQQIWYINLSIPYFSPVIRDSHVSGGNLKLRLHSNFCSVSQLRLILFLTNTTLPVIVFLQKVWQLRSIKDYVLSIIGTLKNHNRLLFLNIYTHNGARKKKTIMYSALVQITWRPLGSAALVACHPLLCQASKQLRVVKMTN